MADLTEISSLSVSSLTSTTRRLLSKLLDPYKVLPTEGPIRRHRDWRGLASLVNISAEEEANIVNYNDKTAKVLEHMQAQAATIGELLNHLTILDRFDVYDDLIVSIKEQPLIRPANQVALPATATNNHNQVLNSADIITYEDRPGHKHKYHAYVLYADADKEFATEMKNRLSSHGFEICTKDNLQFGYASIYPPIARLISERCQRIILVYSPEFLQSPEHSFFRDYAQAVSIEMNQRRLLPIMYRQCVLPQHLRIYHMLYFDCAMNNFWERLVQSMQFTRYQSVNGEAPLCAPVANHQPPQSPPNASPTTNSHSAVDIVTATDSEDNENDQRYFLPSQSAPIGLRAPVVCLPNSGSFTQSLTSLTINTTDPINGPIKKKKRGIVKRCVSLFTGKKNKKKAVDAMTPVCT